MKRRRVRIPFALALGVIAALMAIPVGYARTRLPQPATTASSTMLGEYTDFTGMATIAERPDSFRLVGDLLYGRSHPSVTPLPNGKLLFFNSIDDTDLHSAELYDPATHTTKLAGPGGIGRASASVTLLPNGQVLILGGNSSYRNDIPPQLYDPDTDTFLPVAGQPSYPEMWKIPHFAIVLPTGKVLIVSLYSTVAELYDPETQTFTPTGSLQAIHYEAQALLLSNGKVLMIGGTVAASSLQSELYDPTTGQWSAGPTLPEERYGATATVLQDGRVLIAGGLRNNHTTQSATALIYDPVTNQLTPTGSMHTSRSDHVAVLLSDGRVLIAGGYVAPSRPNEIYDPMTGTFTNSGLFQDQRYAMTGASLPNNQALLVGGVSSPVYAMTNIEEGPTLVPANNLTATLRLPSGWTKARVATLGITASASGAPVKDASISLTQGRTWLPYFPVQNGGTISITMDIGSSGANKQIVLRLRDVNGQEAIVVTGMLNLDYSLPRSTMAQLPASSPPTVALSWSGSDNLSGVTAYDIEARRGTGPWGLIAQATSTTSMTYTVPSDGVYYFRMRAIDRAGNVEGWRPYYDATTLVDARPPTGTVVINGNARATTAPTLTLGVAASDAGTSVATMRFSDNAIAWTDWQPYTSTATFALRHGDGNATVWAQFRDASGNVSSPVSDTIRLDESVGSQPAVAINAGAAFTNDPHVSLRIAVPAGTYQMQIGNDAGFSGVAWQSFDSQVPWVVSSSKPYASLRRVYVRVRGADGTPSAAFYDDIGYDPQPPTGSVAVGTIDDPQVQVVVTALDPDLQSGVAAMRIAPTNTFAQAQWESYAPAKTLTIPGAAIGDFGVCAQFRDAVGNVGPTSCSSRPAPKPTVANLLRNPGFENDTNNDGVPDGWSTDVHVSRDTTTAHSGHASMLHRSDDSAYYVVTQVVPYLSGDATYLVGGWVNIPATTDLLLFRPEVQWRNAQGALLGTSPLKSYAGATAGWDWTGATVHAPVGTTSATVRMVVAGLSGTIATDDWVFQNSNLLVNPGFEVDANADHVADGWSNDSHVVQSADAVRSGRLALRLASTTDSASTITQVVSNLQAGVTYNLSASVNIPPTSDAFVYRIDIVWRNASNAVLGTTIARTFTGATNGWERAVSASVAPPGTTNALVRMSASSLNAMIYVDDFVLEAANLVVNGGFEADSDHNGLADSWTADSHVSRSATPVHSGGYALKHAGVGNASYVVSQYVAVQDGRTYAYDGWVNIPATRDVFSFRLTIVWRTSTGRSLGTTTLKTYTLATNGWDETASVLQPPPGAASAELGMVSSSLGTPVYVDDVSLRP